MSNELQVQTQLLIIVGPGRLALDRVLRVDERRAARPADAQAPPPGDTSRGSARGLTVRQPTARVKP